MLKKDKLYSAFNISVIAFAIAFFGWRFFYDYKSDFSSISYFSLAFWAVVAIFVYIIKYYRLYFILYGLDISKHDLVQQFCKTAPVNIILPLKIGEIFRAYCYGHTIKNYMKGIYFIILDRFMDTFALFTVLLLLSLVSTVNFTILFYFLFIFLVCVVIGYFIFPSIFSYWNAYLLKSKASSGKIKLLKIINKCNDLYVEVRELVQGKGVILYILSLVAWIVEGTGVFVFSYYISGRWSTNELTCYLESAIGISDSVYQRSFVLVSIIILMTVYVTFFVLKKVNKRGG